MPQKPFITLAIVGTIAIAILLFYFATSPRAKPPNPSTKPTPAAVAPTHAPDNPCAVAEQSSMGRALAPGPPDAKLQWDKNCPSGMRWVK